MAIGAPAPDFSLPDPRTGSSVTLSQYAVGGKATLVMFLCNHCPFVIHLKPAIAELAKEYQVTTHSLHHLLHAWFIRVRQVGMLLPAFNMQARGVKVVAISSNSVQTHPQDGPEKMAADAEAFGK